MASRVVATAKVRPGVRPRPPHPSKGLHQRRCVYCGRRSIAVACSAHRDLVALDPNMEGG